MIRNLLPAILAALGAACMAYQPPSERGYDYDRGRALARNDIRAGQLIYYASGENAGQLIEMGKQIEARCGFRVKPAYPDADPEVRVVDFVEGYNSVSIPLIEERLGSTIDEALEHCMTAP